MRNHRVHRTHPNNVLVPNVTEPPRIARHWRWKFGLALGPIVIRANDRRWSAGCPVHVYPHVPALMAWAATAFNFNIFTLYILILLFFKNFLINIIKILLFKYLYYYIIYIKYNLLFYYFYFIYYILLFLYI